MVVIQSERLLLREFEETDWQAVHSYASDPEVVRFMDWGPNAEDETKAFISRSISSQKEKPRRKYTLAITLKGENKLIGSCDVCVASSENKEGWLGYCLNRHFWRKGYAAETAKALLEFGFKQLALHRIFAKVDPDNIASRNVLEKIGMLYEGHLREHKWAKGEWRDSLLYAMLENEWKRTRTKHKE
ncbi:MAG: GNAT family N-acetyltransferase [Candidatus Bathyarchaeota archaeon]|nr:GNAT family N-acetyltransferase [Candidatus Bathyarchaeota archaeon]MDH5495131.1 GNAT family N-acetyltransferase [Candidatus Bathyarchaeota archaeon]